MIAFLAFLTILTLAAVVGGDYPKPTSLLRDEDCPECGWPETYAEVDLSAETPGADAIGCRKCGWRVEAAEVRP